LNTPAGRPASSTASASATVSSTVRADGLSTSVQPAASAGAYSHATEVWGARLGVIAATTPIGSRRITVARYAERCLRCSNADRRSMSA
jgi:hypothetical protein